MNAHLYLKVNWKNNLVCIFYENTLPLTGFIFFFSSCFPLERSAENLSSFLQTKNAATSSSRRKLQLIFISVLEPPWNFANFANRRALKGKQIAKVFRNIRPTFHRHWNAWRKHRIAQRNYFLARRANSRNYYFTCTYLFLTSARARQEELVRIANFVVGFQTSHAGIEIFLVTVSPR